MDKITYLENVLQDLRNGLWGKYFTQLDMRKISSWWDEDGCSGEETLEYENLDYYILDNDELIKALEPAILTDTEKGALLNEIESEVPSNVETREQETGGGYSNGSRTYWQFDGDELTNETVYSADGELSAKAWRNFIKEKIAELKQDAVYKRKTTL